MNRDVIRLKIYLASQPRMPTANPYSAPSASSLRTSALPERRIALAFILTFFFACILGTESGFGLGYSLLGGEVSGSILWEQPVRNLAECAAIWLLASMLIGSATYMLVAHRSFSSSVLRGLLAGFTFASLISGAKFLSVFLAREGFDYDNILCPTSLPIRFLLYASLVVCFDTAACLLLLTKRRITMRWTEATHEAY